MSYSLAKLAIARNDSNTRHELVESAYARRQLYYGLLTKSQQLKLRMNALKDAREWLVRERDARASFFPPLLFVYKTNSIVFHFWLFFADKALVERTQEQNRTDRTQLEKEYAHFQNLKSQFHAERQNALNTVCKENKKGKLRRKEKKKKKKEVGGKR